MATGKVKWFNEDKGYGFIQPDDGGKDVFVHVTALQSADIHDIREGESLSYELEERRGKFCAANLKRIG